jgi:hypothetical protein
MAVVALHRMATSPEPKHDEAAAFAGALLDRWALGDPECDNGAVLLLAAFEGALALGAGGAIQGLLGREGVRAAEAAGLPLGDRCAGCRAQGSGGRGTEL